MKKLSFKLSREQMVGISELTTSYLEEITWREVRGHWMRHALFSLVQRMDKHNMKCLVERRPACKVALPLDECFAMVLLYDQHPVQPADYLDNTILQMLNTIKQYYA
jgi:hypothetical protein